MLRSKSFLAISTFMMTLLPLAASAQSSKSHRDWGTYLGDQGRSHYSSLEQIHSGNVGTLGVAWTFHSGDASPSDRSQIQCNPIIVDGVLYGVTPRLQVFALDAANGEERWRFDPFAREAGPEFSVSRGVTYWRDGHDTRILFSASHYLYQLDAKTGEILTSFGEDGRVDLREGLDRDASNLHVVATSPGALFRDLLIMGTRVDEGPGKSAPGHIRAYDVRTGTIRWIFHTIPHPGEFGYDTWPEDAWKRVGGANSWAGMSVDLESGLVFIPTGSPAFDFWGGDRAGDNLFGNTLLALKAETGERVWHFQAVHHDVWDRDLPAPPNLLTIEHDGKRVDAVAQITKSGHVFVFDRETGKPLFSVKERAFPNSDLKGESLSPTQPIPLKPPPFARQSVPLDAITTLSDEDRNAIHERWTGIHKGPFAPPDTEGTLIYPGFDGGGEWGGAATDPETGMLYVNSSEMPWILTMVDMREAAQRATSAGERVYQNHCASCHGPSLEGDPQQDSPSLTEMPIQIPDPANVHALLEHGQGRMPSFEYISEAERKELVEFLYDPGAARVPDYALPPPHIPYSHTGYNRFLDPNGYPATTPPWGQLTAIDLNQGEIVWQVPLGEFAELTDRGIPLTGTENYGGPVVTAGGLVFIAATKDEKFRAFDKATGEMLWEVGLPAGGYATPSSYEVNGKQYVVIAAGGGKMGTKSGDAYVAFALP